MGFEIKPPSKAPAKTTSWPQTDKAATPLQKTPFRRTSSAEVNRDHGQRIDNADNSYKPEN